MKKDKIIYWTATIFILLFEGLMPLATLLFAPQYATAGTEPLGYPNYFAYALIVCKVLGVIAITLPQVSPKVKEWAYAGFTFNLLFAALSHAVVDGNIGFVIMPIVILGILAVSYYYADKISKND
ncbi:MULTISPECIES: DoxX family protein [unclassified Flavobacterium]|uniref:DoxX family protein n=1 Tax=unclassified Flavobacterium TaxID=196869 RepID=UPI000EAC2776|nr:MULTISPECIES: DoxX family protein [unclassified Flavobacterium]RKS02775.1 DoxX-like protein [Flavobacterium sp. 102]